MQSSVRGLLTFSRRASAGTISQVSYLLVSSHRAMASWWIKQTINFTWQIILPSSCHRWWEEVTNHLSSLWWVQAIILLMQASLTRVKVVLRVTSRASAVEVAEILLSLATLRTLKVQVGLGFSLQRRTCSKWSNSQTEQWCLDNLNMISTKTPISIKLLRTWWVEGLQTSFSTQTRMLHHYCHQQIRPLMARVVYTSQRRALEGGKPTRVERYRKTASDRCRTIK